MMVDPIGYFLAGWIYQRQEVPAAIYQAATIVSHGTEFEWPETINWYQFEPLIFNLVHCTAIKHEGNSFECQLSP